MFARSLLRPTLALRSSSRLLHTARPCLVKLPSASDSNQRWEQNTQRERKQKAAAVDPFSVPLTEQASELAGDLKEKLSEAASKARSLGKRTARSIKKTGSGIVGASRLHTLAPLSARDLRDPILSEPIERPSNERFEDVKADVKEEAGRLKDDLAQAPELARSAAHDVKEGAERVWETVKGAGRKVKDTVGEMAHEASLPRSPASLNEYNSGVASAAFTPEDLTSESNPVRHAARSETLSTTAGRRSSWTPSRASEEEVAEQSGDSIGLGQESLRKSMWDGPQEMPQGVGKRARDAQGKPMETGTQKS